MDFKFLLELAPSGGMTYLGWMLSGLMWTMLVSIAAWIIAFVLGSIIGVLRTVPLKIPRLIATTYVEIFRNIPLLVQMFLWYFVMPEIVPAQLGDWLKGTYPNLITLPFAQIRVFNFVKLIQQIIQLLRERPFCVALQRLD